MTETPEPADDADADHLRWFLADRAGRVSISLTQPSGPLAVLFTINRDDTADLYCQTGAVGEAVGAPLFSTTLHPSGALIVNVAVKGGPPAAVRIYAPGVWVTYAGEFPMHEPAAD